MPSVAQKLPTAQLSKKRRRDDESHPSLSSDTLGDESHVVSSSQLFDHGGLSQHYQAHPPAIRKTIPLPPGKRQKALAGRDAGADEGAMPQSQHRHPTKENARGEEEAPEHSARPAVHPATAAPMSRCHICSRRPSKKSDLDSFADCQGCGRRTCFVCMRECLGWGGPGVQLETYPTPFSPAAGLDPADVSFTMLDVDADVEEYPPAPAPPAASSEQRKQQGPGQGRDQGWTGGGGHRQVVCSRCCVEKGPDGDVVCLGCLPFVES
ncbi:a3222451-4216-4766-898d-4abdc358a8ed [Thermothielavioides terrestris]|nr:a3222451-4216-4766-898d-4abdc358a8ed [Thermothielavioides terrestris]